MAQSCSAAVTTGWQQLRLATALRQAGSPPQGSRGRARSGDRRRGGRGGSPQRLMRIVADTNTLVSGFGWGGPPGHVVDTVLSGQVTLVISPALLGELARVQSRTTLHQPP
jgi:hypothetical protein